MGNHYTLKSEEELIKELNEAHKVIMSVRAQRDCKYVGSEHIAHCFRQVSTDAPYKAKSAPWNGYVQTLKRHGYLIIRWPRDGGMGWEVNPKYLRGENEVKTTLLAQLDNIKNKLAGSHSCAYEVLTDLVKASPSFTVYQLVEALEEPGWKNESELFKQKTNVESERLALQKGLEAIEICHLDFKTDGHDSSGELNNVNLWQAYRIGQVLQAATKKIAPAHEYEAEPEPEPELGEIQEHLPQATDNRSTRNEDGSPF